MEDSDAIKEHQMKLLGKLSWLVGRTKPDFKGNPPPPPRNKTKESVELAKRENAKHLQGGVFGAYGHIPVPLSMEATKNRTVSAVRSPSPPREALNLPANHHNKNPYRQVLNPDTGRPEVYDVLQGAVTGTGEPVKGRRRFPGTCNSTVFTNSSRPSARDVDLATPQERLQLLRADALQHPKFCDQSRFIHAADHWDPTSQLGPDAQMSPPRKFRAPLFQRRNEVRMVGIMRRSPTASAWK